MLKVKPQGRVLVTGGAGYIGTHVIVELLKVGYKVLVIDNFANSSKNSLKRVESIASKRVDLIEGDIRDKKLLGNVFQRYDIFSVIHLAGLKSVGESVQYPTSYYDNNVVATLKLLEVMAEFNVKNIVFSSSATIYGKPSQVPITESASTGPGTNPYGSTKYVVECILQDIVKSDSSWSVCSLRYFNPIGAHVSGQIGESPNGEPNNLVPFISRVAMGKLPTLRVFGDDYDTNDGTGVRDYIHVVDLAKGHVAALDKVSRGFYAINLGTGRGYSVFDIIRSFEDITGRKVPFEVVNRRAGDIAECYASPLTAKKLLNWEAKLTLKNMITDQWRWQTLNPNGYEEQS